MQVHHTTSAPIYLHNWNSMVEHHSAVTGCYVNTSEYLCYQTPLRNVCAVEQIQCASGRALIVCFLKTFLSTVCAHRGWFHSLMIIPFLFFQLITCRSRYWVYSFKTFVALTQNALKNVFSPRLNHDLWIYSPFCTCLYTITPVDHMVMCFLLIISNAHL